MNSFWNLVRIMFFLLVCLDVFFVFKLLNAQNIQQDMQNVDKNSGLNSKNYEDILNTNDVKTKLDLIVEIYKKDEVNGFEILCNHYFIEKDLYVKKFIVDAVGYKVDIERCIDVLNDAISSTNESIKKAAVLAINNENVKKIKGKVYNLIKNEESIAIKNTAMIKISYVDRSTETVKVISDEISKGENEDVIKAGFKALSNINTKDAKAEIEKHSKSRNKRISDEAKKYIKK